MKKQHLIFIAIGGVVLYELFSKRAVASTSITATPMQMCVAQDGTTFQWPVAAGACPYADHASSGVAYAYDASGNLQPVVF